VTTATPAALMPMVLRATGHNAGHFGDVRETVACRQVVGAASTQCHSYVANAATVGRPLLVTDVDQPFSETVARITGHLSMKQRELRVTHGDKTARVADGFRLYITTRLSRPPLLDETATASYIDVVDFTLADEAVTDQLLTYIFQLEKPVGIQQSY